mmetsp:Transcript_24275/g.83876  ORF Transcript_24275/g.83876 Transcript_24275/m.83876 type:complete len:443 (-) Transcript_24275:11-1339(-)
MRLAEGHAAADEVLREVRGEHLRRQRSAHLISVQRQRAQAAGGDGDGQAQRLGHVEHGLLVFLEVLVVSRRQRGNQRRQPLRLRLEAARLGAQQLQRVRVALLRHQRGPRRVGLAELDVPKLFRAVDDQILCPAREVRTEQRAELRKLDAKVAVRDGVEGILRDTAEPELCAEGLAVRVAKKRMARQGARPERAGVRAPRQVVQALRIARPRPGVREGPVGPADGLGALEVRVAWEERVERLLLGGVVVRRLDELAQLAAQHKSLAAEPELHVGGDLVVARPARVQPARDVRPDQLAEAPLVGRVDVLVRRRHDDKRTARPLLLDLREALCHLGGLVFVDDARLAESARVGLRAVQVGGPERLVVADGGVHLVEVRVVGHVGKRAAPELLRRRGRCRHLGHGTARGAPTAAKLRQQASPGQHCNVIWLYPSGPTCAVSGALL